MRQILARHEPLLRDQATKKSQKDCYALFLVILLIDSFRFHLHNSVCIRDWEASKYPIQFIYFRLLGLSHFVRLYAKYDLHLVVLSLTFCHRAAPTVEVQ